MLFALDPLWNDVYTAGGFWVGVVGLLVGVAGFWIAIVQIREARRAAEAGKKAAEAAEEAAKKTLAESKDAYERFVGAFASRLLSELQRAVNNKDWRHAETRAQDLAELLGTLPDFGPAVAGLVRELRAFGQRLAARPTDGDPKLSPTKWNALLNDINARLDRLRAPFRRPTDAGDDTHDERTTVPDSRREAPPADPEGGSQLG